MNEKDVVEKLYPVLTYNLKNYTVTKGEALIYKIIVNEKGEFQPKCPEKPKRANLSFQTDLLVKKEKIPLVVIETKAKGFSTHDVLTYSTKALKHKEVYPYLRYGLVVGDAKIIQNRFFTHNIGFDFAIALVRNPNTEEIKKFIDVIKSQIDSAEKLLNILKEKNQTKSFNTILKFENV
jgi:hypothetical protein